MTLAQMERAARTVDASIALARVSTAVRSSALATMVIPLGVAVYVSALASLPMRLLAAVLREATGGTTSGGTDVKAIARGLWAQASDPTLVGAVSAEMRDDAAMIREMSARARARVEEFKAASETEREKFLSACARLKEEAVVRERLRDQLETTREELKRERAMNYARGGATGAKDGSDSSSSLFLSTATLGVALLYFHDIDTVHVMDKKIAAAVPAMWMLAMMITSRALRGACVVVNLILAGYFFRVVCEHRRALGHVAHVVS